MISTKFPASHLCKGDETHFRTLISRALDGEPKPHKVHTIRANYDLWKHRSDEIIAGRAILNIKSWSGLPYRNSKNVLFTLDKQAFGGVQRLTFRHGNINYPEIDGVEIDGDIISQLAHNDGLSKDQWVGWFAGYDLTKPMAIIQFTNFKY